MRETAGVAADERRIHNESALDFALNAYVDVVAAPNLVVGIVLERERLAERRRGNHRRGRRAEWRQGNSPIHTNPERGSAGIGASKRRVAALPGRARGGAVRQLDIDGLAESDAEHRDEHRLNDVGAVIDHGETASKHRLPVAHNVSQEPVSAGIPGKRNARSEIAIIDVENCSVRQSHRHPAQGRIVDGALGCAIQSRGHVVGCVEDLAAACVDLYGLPSLNVVRRGLPTVGKAVVERERIGHAPGVLPIEVGGVLIGDIDEICAERGRLQLCIANRQDIDVVQQPESRRVEPIPGCKIA